MKRKVVRLNRFIPYTLDDLAVVIPHSARMTNRWKWFWPQFTANTPEAVLRNTVVVFHRRDGPVPVPDDVEAVEDISTLLVLDRVGSSPTWPLTMGIKHTKARLIARIEDDVELRRDDWAESALEVFNEEPHLKILGSITDAARRIKPEEKIWEVPFVKELLFDGQYTNMAYVHGAWVITNRAVWMAYYSEMEDYCRWGEDLFFHVLSRADGVPAVRFSGFFKHRGEGHRDRIGGVHDTA